MRWRRGTGGGQVEDRRGASLTWAEESGGIGLLVLLLFYLLGERGGADAGPLDPLPRMPGAQGQAGPDAQLKDFVSFVVQDVQGSWTTTFANAGKQYQPTKLVLFDGATRTGCGVGSSQTGPSTARSTAGSSTSGSSASSSRFGAGDFAQAYVIAHGSGTTCKACSASWTKCSTSSPRARRTQTTSRSIGCKPTASPASGPTRRTRKICSKRGPRGRSRRGDRRRPPPGAGHGSHQPGELDARLIGAADKNGSRRASTGGDQPAAVLRRSARIGTSN